MKKALLAALVAVLALTAGCKEPVRRDTAVTFTIQAYGQLHGDRVVPLIDVVAMIPGYAPWRIGDGVPAPWQGTITSSKYPPAEFEINLVAQLVEPNPDVILKCTWSALTPAGQRLSSDSTGGEGESLGAPVTCKYFA
jgi:predicted secreted protein